MSILTALAAVDLVLLVVTALLGLASLLAWARHRAAGFPTGRIAGHIVLQLAGIGVWAWHVATGSIALAWAAFGILTAGQVLGDLLMLASRRARHPGEAGGYRAAAADVLGFRRPVPALHAIVGAVAWFGMLGLCFVVMLG